MYKTYQSNSDLAFNVKMEKGIKRIVFEGQSLGTSIYSTRDPKEQKAIEAHYWFGDKFWCVEAVDETKKTSTSKKQVEKKENKKTHTVTDIADAKDYLAEEFGISRTKMKTKDDVLSIAKEMNVVLEGL